MSDGYFGAFAGRDAVETGRAETGRAPSLLFFRIEFGLQAFDFAAMAFHFLQLRFNVCVMPAIFENLRHK
ncbi:MAG: hypothetical protein LBL57_09245 [Tannerella sp.]|jgi:hypothetical protein|nr:hypothetical protein [Tannerella sp.]